MQIAELQQDKGTLTQNISVLYNTAKLEIQRKDEEIKELRNEINRNRYGTIQYSTTTHDARAAEQHRSAVMQQHTGSSGGGGGRHEHDSRHHHHSMTRERERCHR